MRIFYYAASGRDIVCFNDETVCKVVFGSVSSGKFRVFMLVNTKAVICLDICF